MTAYYNEIDPKAAAWLRELIKQGHIADGVVDDRSIVDVTPDELRGFTQCHFFAGIGVWSYALRSAGWADDRPVWTGSCPCQPFSAAGARGGFDDQRHLWPHWHHLISQCRPSVVFGEQVASKDGLGWLDLVHADMEATGYAFGAADLCAAGVGAPHIRQRLWFVGLADAEDAGSSHRRPRPVQPIIAVCSGTPDRLADADNVRHGIASATARNGEGDAGETIAQDAGSYDRLADAADAGLQIGRGGSGGEPGSVEQSERLRADGGMADADDTGPQGHGQSGGFNVSEGRPDAGRHGAEGGLDCRLADAAGSRQFQRGLRDGGEFQRSALSAQSEGGPQASGAVGPDENVDMAQRYLSSGPTNGFWRDADWLFCRDGKWRPVEPSTFPLAHGSAARVGRLRGYGNAIAAPVAQTFIESVMEILE
jgi:DNA (cytosine-5)-methyltransferase 1